MPDDKHLLLLRHAKSSWEDPALTDHERPLAPRGRRAAKLIRSYLRESGIPVSLVLCSSARRARETLELVEPGGEIRVEDGLYAASASELIGRLRHVPDETETVMLVGHNPGIQELAAQLSGDRSPLVGRRFPTGALAALSFNGPWRRLAPGQAQLTSFITPRELG